MRNVRIVGLVAFVAIALTFTLGTGAHAEPSLARYVVTFDGAPTAEQLEVLSGVALGVHGFEHLPAAVVLIDPLDARLLRGLPGVAGAYPVRSLKKMLRQSTRTVRADQAWDLGYNGAGIGVAVIDTGIDGTRADLCARAEFCNGTSVRTVQNVKFVGMQTAGVDPILTLEDQINTDTSSGHGSHVAGIVGSAGVSSAHEGSKYRGVAWGSNLVGFGTGELLSVDNVLAAFDWILDHPSYNIRVINNSWGPDSLSPYDPGDPVNLAINAAHDAGISVVFGSGNGGPTTDVMNAFSVNPKAISVAGGTKGGDIAFFSSRGVPGSPFWHPTVTAPGYNIVSVRSSTGFYGDIADATAGPNPDLVEPPDNVYYATASGTSMAAPHVSGIIALMQQASFQSRGVYLTPDEVKNVLQNTAVSRDPARGRGGLPNYQQYSMGAGYADAQAAVEAASAGAQTQPYDAHVNHEVRSFGGALGAQTTSFSREFVVQPGALSLDVMTDWGLVANDVDIDLYAPGGALNRSTFLQCAPDAEPNGYSSFCTTIANERVTVTNPVAGTWRAVIHTQLGVPALPDTVRGVWSAAYPDTVSVSHPAAAAVTVTASPAAANVAGQGLKLVASVRDAAGNPIPNAPVAWTSSGVGSLGFGETITRADGTAQARAESANGGTQTVVAASGSASGSIAVTWLGLPALPGPASSPGAASGGGWIMDPAKRTLGFSVEYRAGNTAPLGDLSYDDKVGTAVRSTSIAQLVISGSHATIEGAATVNGAGGYNFRLEIVDNGSPGRNDTFEITLTKDLDPFWSYTSDGTLGGGNLVVAT